MGEAAHPGPQLRVVSGNCTSLLRHMEDILGIEADVLVLQEVRLTEEGMELATREAEDKGWDTLWGRPQPRRRGTHRDQRLDARPGGVGTLVRKGVCATVSPRTAEGERLYETGCWNSTAVRIGEGAGLVHIVNVYGHAGATAQMETMQRNEELLEALWMEANSIPEEPVVIMGDFNVDPGRSQVVARNVAEGVWVDVAAQKAHLLDMEPEDTYHGPQGARSRIDYAILNQAAMQLFEDVELLRDTGCPNHAFIKLTLGHQGRKQTALRCKKPMNLPDAVCAKLEEGEASLLEATVVDQYVGQFDKAHRERDVDGLWAVWSEMAEDFLIQKAAMETGEFDIAKSARYRGRGRSATPQMGPVAAYSGRGPAGAQQPERRGMVKLLALLAEMDCKAGEEYAGELRGLWSKAARVGKECLKDLRWAALWAEADPPGQERVRQAKAELQDLLQDLGRREREQLIAKWKRRRDDAIARDPGKLHQYFRAEKKPFVAMVRRPDGTLTAKIEEMDRILRGTWEDTFRKHRAGGRPAPSEGLFFARYGHLVRSSPMEANPIEVEQIAAALARMSAESSGGVDGWTPRDFKQLPREIIGMLSHFYDVVEETGCWPEQLAWATVSLIPKGEGALPSEMRPLSIMAVAYRVWAAVRAQEALSWQETWVHPGQHGSRRGHSVSDALVRIGLEIEEAALTGNVLMGVAVDLEKAFDNVPVDIAMRVLERSGMNERILKPLRGMYGQLKKRFKIGRCLGQEFTPTNGIMQGCPLSILLLSAVLSVGARAVDEACPGIIQEAYVDDLTLLARDNEILQRAVDHWNAFLEATDQKMNLLKTKGFGVNASPDIRAGGREIPTANEVKVLGAILTFVDGIPHFTMDEKKIREAELMCERIRYAGLPFWARVNLVTTKVIPRVLHGCEVLDVRPRQERRLRTAITAAIWEKVGRKRSPGLLLTLFAKGHLADATQALPYGRVMRFRRCMLNRPELQGLAERVLRNRRRQRGLGPGRGLLQAARRLGARWVTATCLNLQGHDTSLIEQDGRHLAHQLRAAAREAVWRQVDNDRGDARGVAAGIDRDRTLGVYRRANRREQGIIRNIVTGAVWTQESRARMPRNRGMDPTCPYCEREVEDVAHLWWRCPRWEDERQGIQRPAAEAPRCFTCLGIATLGLDPDTRVEEIQRMMVRILTRRFRED